MESPTCVYCGETSGGDVLCSTCAKLKDGERGFQVRGSPNQTAVCLVQQAEGHPVVRLFKEPSSGAKVVAEVPSGSVIRCCDRAQKNQPFYRAQWRDAQGAPADGWVGFKNVSWHSVLSKDDDSGSEDGSLPGTPRQAPASPAPSEPNEKPKLADEGLLSTSIFNCFAKTFGGPVEKISSLRSKDSRRPSRGSGPSPRVQAAQRENEFGLNQANTMLFVPDTPQDSREVSLYKAAHEASHKCNFLKLTVWGPEKLREQWDKGKTSTLELYSPYCRVPQDIKDVLITEVQRLSESPVSRRVGALVGMAVADAAGAPFEFMSVRDGPRSHAPKLNPQTLEIEGKPFNKFRLKKGQWSDDTAMGLCLADTLLEHGKYSGSDVRIRFHNWWFRGYNNAFGNDTRVGSVGLGGNVSKSLAAMREDDVPPDNYGADTEDAGNGSLMRLAAVPIFYSRDPLKAAKISAESSKSTHPGTIAAAACAFLGFTIAKAISRDSSDNLAAKDFLDATVKEFIEAGKPGAEDCSEVQRLLDCREPKGKEECWNWRQPKLRIEASMNARGSRYNGYPCSAGYFGSYCIDGLAIALWGFYHTDTFKDAVVSCVNCFGDADTTAAICGQLAGAFYGFQAIPEKWLKRLYKWDDKDTICRAVMLHCCSEPDDADNRQSISVTR